MRTVLWDFDGTIAERPGLWSQCLADLANAHAGLAIFRREQFAAHLQAGFPWHSPQLPHLEIQTSDAWWSKLHPTLEHAFIAGGGFSHKAAAELAHAVRCEYTNPRN